MYGHEVEWNGTYMYYILILYRAMEQLTALQEERRKVSTQLKSVETKFEGEWIHFINTDCNTEHTKTTSSLRERHRPLNCDL